MTVNFIMQLNVQATAGRGGKGKAHVTTRSTPLQENGARKLGAGGFSPSQSAAQAEHVTRKRADSSSLSRTKYLFVTLRPAISDKYRLPTVAP